MVEVPVIALLLIFVNAFWFLVFWNSELLLVKVFKLLLKLKAFFGFPQGHICILDASYLFVLSY